MKGMTITGWLQTQLKPVVKKASLCVDATAGKGNDTLFLSNHINENGKVLAFDIQSQALKSTKELLNNNNISASKWELIQDSHTNMDEYVSNESVDVVMFNLGYLPGGDHKISTKAVTTITAIKKALDLLKKGGIMSICIYSGGDSGFEEKEEVLSLMRSLDAKKYTVIRSDFYNKSNHPPIPIIVQKDRN